MSDTVQAFQLGSSTVVTLPKKLGIQPGQKMEITKKGKQIILKEEELTKNEIEKFVRRLSGGLNLKYHPTPDELNKILDEEYDKMLP